MLKALNIKLYPNSQQKTYFGKIFGCSRKVYNLCLDKAITEYENGNNFCNLIAFTDFFHKELLKSEDFIYLNEHNTKILKDSLKNLSTAYSNFFKKVQKDTGFPNFKKRSEEQSIGLYKEAFSKKVFYKENFMFISKNFGFIKYKTSSEYKELLEKYKDEIVRINIKKLKTGEYFAQILIDLKEIKEFPKTDNIIGIDLGVKGFVITSEAEVFENLKLRKKYAKKVARLNRGLARKKLVETGEVHYNKKWKKDVKVKKPSKNHEKNRIKIAKLSKKITDVKKNYIHTVTNSLLRDNQTIVMEDLNVSGMMKNHKLAGAIQDVNLGEFKLTLKYKAEWYGKEIIEISRWFPSSKKCNCCGYIKKDLKLSDRQWTCPNCGESHDRDVNAAINIREEGIRIIGCRTSELTLEEKTSMDDPARDGTLKSMSSMNQEKTNRNILHVVQ